jgi:hypothetical protein
MRTKILCFAGLALASLLVTFGAFLVAATPAGAANDTLSGTSRCTQVLPAVADYGEISRVVAGDTTTVAEVTAWQESGIRGGFTSPMRAYNASQSVTVCLYQGQFAVPVAPPRPNETPQPDPDTIRLLVFPNGRIVLDSAGPLAQMQPYTPADWRAAGN